MTAYTIVGQQHLNTRLQRAAWYALKAGDSLKLKRDPQNPVDKNAVEVYAPAGMLVDGKRLEADTKVGFIRAKEAALLSPWLEQHGQHAAVHYEKPNHAKVTVKARQAAT